MEDEMKCFCCERELPSEAFNKWEPGHCASCAAVDRWVSRVLLANPSLISAPVSDGHFPASLGALA